MIDFGFFLQSLDVSQKVPNIEQKSCDPENIFSSIHEPPNALQRGWKWHLVCKIKSCKSKSGLIFSI